MKSIEKEWTVDAPWGKIALASWGNPNGERILLVHGRQDSLATFIPLLQYFPDKYYCVGLDMPGNGRSDPFPVGVKLSRFHFIAAVEVVVKHLAWDQFMYIGHSMGCEQGLFFRIANPNRITKLVLLDFGPSLQRLQVRNLEEYYNMFYKQYYDNYHRDNCEVKLYKYDEAIAAVCRARSLTPEQAALVLSRCLHPVGDKYRLSWDRRLRLPAPQNYPIDDYHRLFSLNTCPTLLISAKTALKTYEKGKTDAQRILSMLVSDSFRIVEVSGGHDVHLTNPERVFRYVWDFLEAKAKL